MGEARDDDQYEDELLDYGEDKEKALDSVGAKAANEGAKKFKHFCCEGLRTRVSGDPVKSQEGKARQCSSFRFMPHESWAHQACYRDVNQLYFKDGEDVCLYSIESSAD